MNIELTFSARIKSPKPPASMTPVGAITKRPPFNSEPQISKEQASKGTEAICINTVSEFKGIK